MKQAFLFLTISVFIFSCDSKSGKQDLNSNLENETQGSNSMFEFENELQLSIEGFNSTGYSDSEKIADYFKSKGCKQIPCKEKRYIMSKNSLSNGIENLVFIKEQDTFIGAIYVQLNQEPFPIVVSKYSFYKVAGWANPGTDEAFVRWYQDANFMDCINSFRYNGRLYSAGFSSPGTGSN